MLSLHSLGFSINENELFRGVSMSFLPSSIVYLKGRNGAGKSSLLRMLADIQQPSSGNITFSKDSLPLAMLKKTLLYLHWTPLCNKTRINRI